MLAKLTFLLSLAVFATIVGTVTDNSGAVVPNAAITITNTATGIARTLTTNDSGQYVASALSIGNYKVKAEAAGFVVVETTGVVLSVNWGVIGEIGWVAQNPELAERLRLQGAEPLSPRLVMAVGPRQSVLPGKVLEKSMTRRTCPSAVILSSSWWLGSTA